MRQPIDDKSTFWQLAPAANEIFSYVDKNPEISVSPWGFDSGNMSDDLSSVWASFSCTSVNGWDKDNLVVTANKQENGGWSVSHKVQRAT